MCWHNRCRKGKEREGKFGKGMREAKRKSAPICLEEK